VRQNVCPGGDRRGRLGHGNQPEHSRDRQHPGDHQSGLDVWASGAARHRPQPAAGPE
jgi:hypothetical protein